MPAPAPASVAASSVAPPSGNGEDGPPTFTPIHIQLDEGLIDAEDFADKRDELMAQIKVD